MIDLTDANPDVLPQPIVAVDERTTVLDPGALTREWSNVVFSAAFCEKMRRDYDRRAMAPVAS